MKKHAISAILDQVLDLAKKAGADEADVLLENAISSHINYRLGKVEESVSSQEMEIGVRVFIGKRQALVSSTDLSEQQLKLLTLRAVEMAQVVPEDPYCGLYEGKVISPAEVDSFDSFDEMRSSIHDLVERAQTAEAAARENKGIKNVDQSQAGYMQKFIGVANTRGLKVAHRKSQHWTSLVAVAGESTSRQREHDMTNAVYLKDLQDPAVLGHKVAKEAIRCLNPRKVPSQKIPIIFDPREGRSLLVALAQAIRGDYIAQEGFSFLKNSMGKEIFHPSITIMDDPRQENGLASEPVDTEGVIPIKRSIVENGILKTWLLDTHSARKLHLVSTGHGFRNIKGVSGPRPTNFYMAPGALPPEELLKLFPKAIYITRILGHGPNITTGDFSQGAAGFMVENGEMTYPIHNFTIAGQCQEMFKTMIAANDLEFKYGIDTPTFAVESMTVAGN